MFQADAETITQTEELETDTPATAENSREALSVSDLNLASPDFAFIAEQYTAQLLQPEGAEQQQASHLEAVEIAPSKDAEQQQASHLEAVEIAPSKDAEQQQTSHLQADKTAPSEGAEQPQASHLEAVETAPSEDTEQQQASHSRETNGEAVDLPGNPDPTTPTIQNAFSSFSSLGTDSQAPATEVAPLFASTPLRAKVTVEAASTADEPTQQEKPAAQPSHEALLPGKTTQLGPHDWVMVEGDGLSVIEAASHSPAHASVPSTLLEALQTNNAETVQAFVHQLTQTKELSVKQAREAFSLNNDHEIDDNMLIALIKAILAIQTQEERYIIHLLRTENSVLHYIIKNKPDLLDDAQWEIQTTKNPVITEGAKTYLSQQVILDFALTTTNFELIDTIVQPLFQQGVRLTENQDKALREAAERFIGGITQAGQVDTHVIHAIGIAYQAGRFSHRPENTRLAEKMKQMDASSVEQIGALDYLEKTYTAMTLGENASVKSQLAKNIGHILTVARIALPQITEKPSPLALLFSRRGRASTSALGQQTEDDCEAEA